MSNEIKKTHKGSGHWINQRLSAMIMLFIIMVLVALYCFYFLTVFILYGKGIMSFQVDMITKLMIVVFYIVAVYHATLGIKVVIEDYIQSTKKKFILISFSVFLSLSSVVMFLFLSFFVTISF